MRLLATLFVLLSASLPASFAEIVTLRMTGEFNRAGNELTDIFGPGDTITFTVTYDTAAPNTFFEPSRRGTYDAISASATIEASTGTYTVSFPEPRISTENESSFQRISFQSLGDQTLSPEIDVPLAIADLRFFTSENRPLDGTALPSSLNRADWSTNPSSSGAFLFFEGTGPEFFTRFSISTIESDSNSGGEPDDGIPALLKEALGIDPATDARGDPRLPRPVLFESDGESVLGLEYSVPDPAPPGFAFSVEAGASPRDFSETAILEAINTSDPDVTRYRYRAPDGFDSATLFMRLRVEQVGAD